MPWVSIKEAKDYLLDENGCPYFFRGWTRGCYKSFSSKDVIEAQQIGLSKLVDSTLESPFTAGGFPIPFYFVHIKCFKCGSHNQPRSKCPNCAHEFCFLGKSNGGECGYFCSQCKEGFTSVVCDCGTETPLISGQGEYTVFFKEDILTAPATKHLLRELVQRYFKTNASAVLTREEAIKEYEKKFNFPFFSFFILVLPFVLIGGLFLYAAIYW